MSSRVLSRRSQTLAVPRLERTAWDLMRTLVSPPRLGHGARALGAVEVVLALALVLLDWFLPALLLCVLAGASLLVRHGRPASLGVVRSSRAGAMAVQVLGWSVAWTLLTVGFTLPVLEHLTGRRQDVSMFAPLEGNLPLLLALVGLSWTLAALVEELAFRGYLLTRLRELLPDGTLGASVAIAVAAVAFGLLHTEQGLIGVVVTTIDACFFTWLRLRYRTLWASVLAHGFNNTIGMTAFFLVGPISGLW